MQRFLELLSRYGEPRLPAEEFERRIGGESYAMLRRERVLFDCPPLTTYECGGCWERSGCPREVLHAPIDSDPDRPYLAVCGADRPACEAVRLSGRELIEVGTSLLELARLLAATYGVTDTHAPSVLPSFPRVYELGRAASGRELVFSPSPHARGFEMVLLARRSPTTVLVPTRFRCPPALLQRYRPGDAVELRVLEDALCIEAGRAALRAPPVALSAEVRRPTRMLVDRDGERPLDADGYLAVNAAADALDLFVDLSVARSTGKCVVQSRSSRGKRYEVELPMRQALLLVELARRRRPMRPSELQTVRDGEIMRPDRLIERLRQAIEPDAERKSWRFIRTVTGAGRADKRYEFAPAAEIRFAFVLPVA